MNFSTAVPKVPSLQTMMSLVVKTAGDGEDVGRPFVRLEDVLLLFEVSEVFDPVGAAGRRRRDEPIHGGFTALERTLQPMKPAERRPTQTLQGSEYECIYFSAFGRTKHFGLIFEYLYNFYYFCQNHEFHFYNKMFKLLL